MQAPENYTTLEYSPKSDIWAAGLLLHELFVGVEDEDYPLPSTDYDVLKALAHEHKLIPKPLPSSCPDVFRLICGRCFEQDPEKRPTALELYTMLTGSEEPLSPAPLSASSSGSGPVPSPSSVPSQSDEA